MVYITPLSIEKIGGTTQVNEWNPVKTKQVTNIIFTSTFDI
jgi:hypothetical protein